MKKLVCLIARLKKERMYLNAMYIRKNESSQCYKKREGIKIELTIYVVSFQKKRLTMAVSQIETIVVCVLTFLTLRLFKKLNKRWSSKKAYATVRDLLWTHDESDRPRPLTKRDKGEEKPNGATHSTRGPIVNVSEDDSGQVPQKGFDFEEFAEVFRKNFPAGRLPPRYVSTVTGEQRRNDYRGRKQFGRSNLDEDTTGPFGDGIQRPGRNPRDNQSMRKTAEGFTDNDDGYGNCPEQHMGRPIASPKELIPVGRLAKYRYLNKEGKTEKPSRFLYTSRDGRFKQFLPCESCEMKGSTAKECLQQNLSHRRLSFQMGQSAARSEPTRTGWHPSWTNEAKKTRFQLGNRNRPATVNRGKSVPKNKNRSAPANKRRASILKKTGAERPVRKGSFAASLKRSYPNTEMEIVDPKPSSSKVILGTVSVRGRKL